MTLRFWLAIVLAPIAGAALYALIGYLTLIRGASFQGPTISGLAVLGGSIALVYELVALIPLYLLIRRWLRMSVTGFVAAALLCWYALSTAALLFIGDDLNSASATAVSMLPVGIGVVALFAMFMRGERVV